MGNNYNTYKIQDTNPTLLPYDNKDIKKLQIANTTNAYSVNPSPVRFDLYVVKKPRTNTPAPEQIYYLINKLEVPAGVVLELGESDLPFITSRDLDIDLFIQSDHPDGALTVTIKQ